MNRLLLIVPAITFFALAGVLGVALFAGDPRELPSVLIGKPVPEFDLPALAGRPGADDAAGFENADLSTGGPALVNFWASWCAPCYLEHPRLMALSRERGITVHGINYRDETDAARGFLARLGDPYARLGVDADGRAAIDWGVYGVPETFVVDGEGQILVRHAGELTDEVIRDLIRPALRAAAASENR